MRMLMSNFLCDEDMIILDAWMTLVIIDIWLTRGWLYENNPRKATQ